MTPVPNHEAYASRLLYTAAEKLFFADHIPGLRLVVDYGSADGRLGKALNDLRGPNELPTHYLPYDSDPRFGVETDWAKVCKEAVGFYEDHGSATTLVFSSVLHEVFSEPIGGTKAGWVIARAEEVGAEYIVIRDMVRDWRLDNEDAKAVEEFLKEPWLRGPDAEREAAENYFSVPADIAEQIEEVGGWSTIYGVFYTPIAVQSRWLTTFPGCPSRPRTHMKIIMRRSR